MNQEITGQTAPVSEASAKRLRRAYESDTYEGTARWGLLFDDKRLVETNVPRLESLSYPHPLEGQPKPPQFLGNGASAPVVAEMDAMRLFGEQLPSVPYPCFLLAGPRKRLAFDPTNVTVGILTAGGLAPGLNCLVDTLVKRHSLLASVNGLERNPKTRRIGNLIMWGYEGSFGGLIAGNRMELHTKLTDAHSTSGGSLLGNVRGGKDNDFVKRAADAVLRDELDILYVIGGNGSLTCAHALASELATSSHPRAARVRIVAAPKTMDNDIHFADVTFGFRTAVDNAVECIRRMHVEAESTQRIAIVELFGAGSGAVALHAADASGETDSVLIPEMHQIRGPAQARELWCQNIKAAGERLANRADAKRHALLVLAEGATMSGEFSHASAEAKSRAFANTLNELVPHLNNHTYTTSRPGHLIRATAPNAFDITLCKETGRLMVETALAGYTACVVTQWQNQFCLVPLSTASRTLKLCLEDFYPASMIEKHLVG